MLTLGFTSFIHSYIHLLLLHQFSNMYQCAAPSAPAYAQAGEEKGAVIKTFDPPQRISAREFFASDGHRWLNYRARARYSSRAAACTKRPFF
jgi:hypothetical protein